MINLISISATEAQEQKTLIQYYRLSWIGQQLIHIPNGGARSSAREGKSLKDMGVRAGVSDLFFAHPISPYHGLWIELKRCIKFYKTEHAANMAISESQRSWILLMQGCGYQAVVAYGADGAIKAITDYLKKP